MKTKTSVTLSASLLEDMDQVLGDKGNRSELIETAVRDYLRRLIKHERDKRELELLNRKAASLNKEAEDVLSYQVGL